MKQNSASRKLIYALLAVGAVLGASLTSGCVSQQGYGYSGNNDMTGQVLSGILIGIGQGLSGL